MGEEAAAAVRLPFGRVYDRTTSAHKAEARANAEKHHFRSFDLDARRSERPILDVLGDLGLSSGDHTAARKAASCNATDIASELVAAGVATEDALARAIGTALALQVEHIGPDDGILTEPITGRSRLIKTCSPGMQPRILLLPRLEDLGMLQRRLRESDELRASARITTRREVHRETAARSCRERSKNAELSLSAIHPDQSARRVLSKPQGAAFAAILMCLIWFAAADPGHLLLALHVVGTIAFSSNVAMRMSVALSPIPIRADTSSPWAVVPSPHPTYSILVALHREEDVVDDLVAALAQLHWPRSRLEVMLVCEGDDPRTIAAAERAIAAQPGFSVVIVPPSWPRTKPKALNFALPLCTGEFLVLYDAEDRPEPAQLETAWRAFAEGDERLACLQASLTIRNGSDNWLAGLFALEYAVLFRGLLPWLARHRLPLPLGGTSNHFRRAALVEVGAWDSHNVTEDADLGIRLCRHGYRIGTIASETVEEAPERWVDWRNQRTRWVKGWMQTWLVHMRHPVRLCRDLGIKGFLAFQLLFFGMIVSAVAHPLFIGLLGYTTWRIVSEGVPSLWISILLAVDLANLVGSYLGFAILAAKTVDFPGRRRHLWRLPSLYVYWLLISVAAGRAFFHLIKDPHHWEKTPHGISARAGAERQREEPSFDLRWIG